MEDGVKFFEQIGRLCVEWSFLEMVTEAALWGLIDLDDRLAPLITWNKDMETRGKMIVEHGSAKHPEETEVLKSFNAKLRIAIQDRNIIVHGLVHKSNTRPSCWTIFRGVGKGKNFPASVEAATIVRTNLHHLSVELGEFNARHQYGQVNQISDRIESGWPKPL